ncbi:S49 family peptidase [Bosea sp. (in: a-proteobacteria)]|uniref:S49 family peptidase n=1 Tax=Bosea sp. (in: a-proteobacteria) TaxID=1871050 RepID=UPI003B3A3AAE
MSLMLPRIAAELIGTPLAVEPGRAQVMLRAVGPRVFGAPVSIGGAAPIPQPTAGEIAGRLDRRLQSQSRAAYPVVDGVAVIEVEGILVHKGSWIGMDCGETSYEGLRTQIERARRDPSVKAVAVEVDSPGGAVSGVFETAAALARLSAEKPTMAILTATACSAAYLLASQARRIVMPEFGFAGSIGAVVMHVDFSQALTEAGVKVTLIASGEHKVDGNPFEPLAQDVVDRLKADLDQVRGSFAEAVARGRGKSLTAKAALATEARVYSGREAVSLGLADALGDPHEAFAAFRQEVARR